LLIRGATVLTMDPAVYDLAVGDVHVRDGTIIAVAQKIETSSAQVIDGSGMICSGFVDTHFHLWNSMFRLYVRADVPSLGYFPVTARPTLRVESSSTDDSRLRGALPNPDSCSAANDKRLFNYLICGGEQGRRDIEPK
jgi:hypothetical protein